MSVSNVNERSERQAIEIKRTHENDGNIWLRFEPFRVGAFSPP